MDQQLDYNDYVTQEFRKEMAGQWGFDTEKRLEAVVSFDSKTGVSVALYRVTVNSESVATPSLKIAIDAYNAGDVSLALFPVVTDAA